MEVLTKGGMITFVGVVWHLLGRQIAWVWLW
jgi:hypothetical protein